MRICAGVAIAATMGLLAQNGEARDETLQLAAARAAPGPAAAVVAKLAPGYLPKGGAPDSLQIIPAPPTAGSTAQARDDDAAKSATALRGGPRWVQATQDANLRFPAPAQNFACALGVEIGELATPRLYRLLERSMTDIGLATYPTKTKFQRARPFTANGAAICTPAEEDFLRHDGSYPSGHSAVGWGWALILAEAAPDRQNEILARGRAFGQSRVVCNVHWLSDTEEGRVIAAATVAAIHNVEAFRSDLIAARHEIYAARKAGRAPKRDCVTEAARLADGA